MPQAYPTGGFKCSDTENVVATQRNVVWDLIKQMGQNVTQGVSIINISMPVSIFEPRSYLERITDPWCYAPIFLTKAANETNPLERLKIVATFALAGLSNTCLQRKPFNPILGETYQGNYSDGTQILVEQSSHHPPISNWQVFGPNNLYHFYGYGEWQASFRGNSVKGRQEGTTIIDFQDGGTISYTLPEVWIGGLVIGERVVEYDGLMKFRDAKSNLGCDIIINPPQTGQSWSSWALGWGKKKNPSDYFIGSIFSSMNGNLDDETSREVLEKVEGSWVGCLEFDGKTYWDWQQNIPKFSPSPVSDPLPSDCRYREDLIALTKGDIEEATKWKSILEVKQRKEAKLRKEGKEKAAVAESVSASTTEADVTH